MLKIKIDEKKLEKGMFLGSYGLLKTIVICVAFFLKVFILLPYPKVANCKANLD